MRWATRTSTSRRIASPISPPMRLEYEGRDRVRVFGIEGKPATEFYKVSISYSAGYQSCRHARLFLARSLRQSAGCRQNTARAAGSSGVEV